VSRAGVIVMVEGSWRILKGIVIMGLIFIVTVVSLVNEEGRVVVDG
jgi:hypothetical protein